ncbi:MAG: Crp/Fnr family transcriptional regulator [Burkholderiales bacterium]
MNSSLHATNPSPRLNKILALLPDDEYANLLPELELIEMPQGWTIAHSGDHVRYIHFPTSGIVSMIYQLENGSASEIALVGNEGMIGISVYMGGDSVPSSTTVQFAGQAYRLSRKAMQDEFSLGGELQEIALLYTQTLIAQTAQVVVCNQHHTAEQQVCRWILMAVDRLQNLKIAFTHEKISHLLGVRRETVTAIAGNLQKGGLITCTRGSITVIDRPQLENKVCECYEAIKMECDRLLPPLPKAPKNGLTWQRF